MLPFVDSICWAMQDNVSNKVLVDMVHQYNSEKAKVKGLQAFPFGYRSHTQLHLLGPAPSDRRSSAGINKLMSLYLPVTSFVAPFIAWVLGQGLSHENDLHEGYVWDLCECELAFLNYNMHIYAFFMHFLMQMHKDQIPR